MKRFLWIMITAIFMVACSESNEEKAEKLIKNEMNKVLVNFDTYEPIETVLDSAYAPVMTADVYNKCFNIPDQLEMMLQLKEESQEAYSMMNSYQRIYSTHDETYKKYKERYESTSKKAEIIENKLKALNDSIDNLSMEEPFFNGYIINHKFRYVTKDGEKSIGAFLFLVDKEISRVEFMIDTEEDKYKAMNELIQLNNTFNQ